MLAGSHLHTGTDFAILCEVCDGKTLMAEELPRKAKQVELHHSQQDAKWADEESLRTSKSFKCLICILFMVEYDSQFKRIWYLLDKI